MKPQENRSPVPREIHSQKVNNILDGFGAFQAKHSEKGIFLVFLYQKYIASLNYGLQYLKLQYINNIVPIWEHYAMWLHSFAKLKLNRLADSSLLF